VTALNKEKELRGFLRNLGELAVAFSGGVDSTYLLKVVSEEIGDKAVAVTAVSPTYPQRERSRAERTAAEMGVRHHLIKVDETQIDDFRENPPNRCYYCKKELFDHVIDYAAKVGIRYVADGSNRDDLGDHRPGLLALKELEVLSPLRQCGFSKEEIRTRSKALGLETWNLPAFACLASRFPYGTPITIEDLHKVEMAEDALFDLGFRVVRVRHHGDIARLEVGSEEIEKVLKPDIRQTITSSLRRAGYAYVALDLEGYRTGSLNETLTDSEKEAR
jgi:uncharacterized protein